MPTERASSEPSSSWRNHKALHTLSDTEPRFGYSLRREVSRGGGLHSGIALDLAGKWIEFTLDAKWVYLADLHQLGYWQLPIDSFMSRDGSSSDQDRASSARFTFFAAHILLISAFSSLHRFVGRTGSTPIDI